MRRPCPRCGVSKSMPQDVCTVCGFHELTGKSEPARPQSWLDQYSDIHNWTRVMAEHLTPGNEITMGDGSYRIIQRTFVETNGGNMRVFEVTALDPGNELKRELVALPFMVSVARAGWKEFARPDISAAAWDEGYRAGKATAVVFPGQDLANPYRTTEGVTE